MKETLKLKLQVLSRQKLLLENKADRILDQVSLIQEKMERMQFEVNRLESLETKKKHTEQSTQKSIPEPEPPNSVPRGSNVNLNNLSFKK